MGGEKQQSGFAHALSVSLIAESVNVVNIKLDHHMSKLLNFNLN